MNPWVIRNAVLTGVMSALLSARADVTAVAELDVQRVFGGRSGQVSVHLRNSGPETVRTGFRTRVLQASSSLTAPFSETEWTPVEILAGQTVVETVRVGFPEIRAETLFLVQWIGERDRVLATSQVAVYPSNMLAELKPLASGTAMGLFDPMDRIKPALLAVQVGFSELQSSGLEQFSGKLLIVAPGDVETGNAISAKIRGLVQKGIAVVWINPVSEPWRAVGPSCVVAEGKGAISAVQGAAVYPISDNPVGQMHLIALAQMAVQPWSWVNSMP